MAALVEQPLVEQAPASPRSRGVQSAEAEASCHEKLCLATCSVGIQASEEFESVYDCNICLEQAREVRQAPAWGRTRNPPRPGARSHPVPALPAAQPVLTLCGHLYCWPCLYR
jgi:hypothetical protein